jgi:FKBP-type peptidyl-prolyl cis-trans isomerase
MRFYALGTNLAIQVGGSVNMKTLLNKEEIDIVLEAFVDTIKEEMTVDPREVLTTYGPALNKLLGERTQSITDRIKQEGQDFIANFLDCNEDAIKTASGMAFCEMKKGDGKQPTIQSNVEVHYHGVSLTGGILGM